VRSRHRSWQVRNKGLLWLLLAAAGIVGWCFIRQQPSLEPFSYISTQSPEKQPGDSPSDPKWFTRSYASSRAVYPYSVVPGGVSGAYELRDAALHDPVVARHFAGFDYERARLVKVSEKRSAYLSYRIGDHVYWTRHKVSLHPGEMLITDGTIVARTRCGNRLASTPVGATSPLEPSSEELERPRAALMPLIPAALVDPIPSPLPDPSIPEQKAGAGPLPAHIGGMKWFIPPFYIPSGSSGGPGAPLAVTPEPSSLLLIGSGLVAVGWRVRKARKRS